MEDCYLVNVPVAIVWTSFSSPRKIDLQVTSIEANVKAWLHSLSDEERLEICERKLVQTQVLFGEEVYVLAIEAEWAQVIIPSQPSSKNSLGYSGWIPLCQLAPKKLNPYKQSIRITSKTAMLCKSEDQCELELSFGTVLPVHQNEGDRIIVSTPTDFGIIAAQDIQIVNPLVKEPPAILVQSAEQWIGTPYVWGGNSSYGYDCSGFVYTICRANGYSLARDSKDQVAYGQAVALNELESGDLLFFANDEGRENIHHVGFYYGNGYMLHAPKTGQNVEIIKLEGTVYEKELCAVRRLYE